MQIKFKLTFILLQFSKMHMAGRVNLLITPEVHSEPSQTSNMELFAKIANGWKLLTILQKALFYMFD